MGELAHDLLEGRSLDDRGQLEVVVGTPIEVCGCVASLLLELSSPYTDTGILLNSFLQLFIVTHYSESKVDSS